MEAGRDTTGPSAAPIPGHVSVRGYPRTLGPEQGAVVEQIVTSGRVLDVLVGAAGTGKTATLAGLVAAWYAGHGRGSMTGLAPSASAAAVLGAHIGIPTENTANWLAETRRDPERLARIDQLRILLTRNNKNNAINGDIDTFVDAAYLAWRADTEAGKQTLLICR